MSLKCFSHNAIDEEYAPLVLLSLSLYVRSSETLKDFSNLSVDSVVLTMETKWIISFLFYRFTPLYIVILRNIISDENKNIALNNNLSFQMLFVLSLLMKRLYLDFQSC